MTLACKKAQRIEWQRCSIPHPPPLLPADKGWRQHLLRGRAGRDGHPDSAEVWAVHQASQLPRASCQCLLLGTASINPKRNRHFAGCLSDEVPWARGRMLCPQGLPDSLSGERV